MTRIRFQTRYGKFHELNGPARQHDGIIFVPARVTLTGTAFDYVFPLADCLDEVFTATKAIVRFGVDAPWVLGRLMRLFGIKRLPVEDRGEKTCFYAAFLAVLPEQGNLAVPFECTDNYLESCLMFSSEDAPPHEVQETIAGAFWGLLLTEPDELKDYKERMLFQGEDIWIRFGVEHGEPYLVEDE
jgi:hypothetical protein